MQTTRLVIAAKHPLAQLKRLIPALLLAALACGLRPEPSTPTPVPSPTPVPTVTTPTADLGSAQNPLILALPPSKERTGKVLNAGKALVSLLEKSTGYHFVSVVPPSEKDLVNGFANGNAHIGVLSPFAYLLASNEGSVEAAFARQQANAIFYGAQYIARSDAGFKTYYDPVQNGNLAEAPVALGQFLDKKPCWTDDISPSGYVVPLGFLKAGHIQTREPAFLAGHVAVVRTIDVGGICDFGATYIDARTYPGLEDQYPDLMKTVNVIWRIPNIIPYETLVFAHSLNEDMRRNLIRSFVDLEGTPDGKSAMQILYGFDAMQVVQDDQYAPFRQAAKASGLDLNTLIK
ncbi:MAG: PhnD/SsuA/transferrin family substrate-binding protein [Anaerolineales bacterium]